MTGTLEKAGSLATRQEPPPFSLRPGRPPEGIIGVSLQKSACPAMKSEACAARASIRAAVREAAVRENGTG